MRVLGIETSCDETGVAVYDAEVGLMAHSVYSQVELHGAYGGVVPELASRDHVRKTAPLIREVMTSAGLQLGSINGVAYTSGPGLVGALLVGAALGRSLAWALGIPAVGVHHMEGHLLAPMLESQRPAFPFIALLVSGGHTMLVEVDAIGCYRILGESLDDAVGEAFDKTAKLLGLPYPGGPELARLAKFGNPDRFRFPRPMTNRPGLDFSFSGLKTFALNTLSRLPGSDQDRADIARGFEDAVADTFYIKCKRAIRQTGIKQLVVAGGVGANSRLRERLNILAGEERAMLAFPHPAMCTDNGAMIAYAGCVRLMAGQREDLTIRARPRWSLESLNELGVPIAPVPAPSSTSDRTKR